MIKKIICLLFVALLLTGCGGKNSDSEFSGQTLSIYNSGEYIDEDLIKKFEDEYDVKILYSKFLSNEEMYLAFENDNSLYDIVIPSDYSIEKMIKNGLIKKIDHSKIPNMKNLYDGIISDFDPGFEYSVPYFWGDVGICYDSTVIDQKDVESQGWEVLRNPKYKGLTYQYDSVRDANMIPLKALGYSMNTEDPDEINAAMEWLLELDETMDPAYVTDEIIDNLASNKEKEGRYMGVVYSGDAAYIISEDENMKFFAPQQGTNFWTDAMVLSSACKVDDLAYAFMNFMLDYDNAYANSSYVGYTSPVEDVMNDLKDGEFEGNEAYIVRAQTSKDEVFHDISDDARLLMSLNWTTVMGD